MLGNMSVKSTELSGKLDGILGERAIDPAWGENHTFFSFIALQNL